MTEGSFQICVACQGGGERPFSEIQRGRTNCAQHDLSVEVQINHPLIEHRIAFQHAACHTKSTLVDFEVVLGTVTYSDAQCRERRCDCMADALCDGMHVAC